MIPYYRYWKYNDFQNHLFDMMKKDIKRMVDEKQPVWEYKKSVDIYQRYVTMTILYPYYFFQPNKDFCFPIF